MAPRSRPAIRKSIIKPGNAHRQGKASVHKKPEKKSSPGKCLNQIFNGLVFVLLGDFGDNLPHSKVGHYIELRGGTVARHVTKDTTFLISSLAKYTEKVLEVRKAWKFRTCKIVTWDWLEDCISALKQKGKLLSIKDYELSKVSRQNVDANKRTPNKKDSVVTSTKINYLGGLADTKLWRIFQDQTAFNYNVTLTRSALDIVRGVRRIEKYTVYLFESYGKPHLYMAGAKFSKGNGTTAHYPIPDLRFPKHFQEAFDDFRKFFKDKTQIDWDERCNGIKCGEDAFIYLPCWGKPLGHLPVGWKEPEWRRDHVAASGIECNGGNTDADGDPIANKESGEERVEEKVWI